MRVLFCKSCKSYIPYKIIFKEKRFVKKNNKVEQITEQELYEQCPICNDIDSIILTESNTVGAIFMNKAYDIYEIKALRRLDEIYFMDFNIAHEKFSHLCPYDECQNKLSMTLNGYFVSKGLLAETINDIDNGKYLALAWTLQTKETKAIYALLDLIKIYNQDFEELYYGEKLELKDIEHLKFFKKYMIIDDEIIEL